MSTRIQILFLDKSWIFLPLPSSFICVLTGCQEEQGKYFWQSYHMFYPIFFKKINKLFSCLLFCNNAYSFCHLHGHMLSWTFRIHFIFRSFSTFTCTDDIMMVHHVYLQLLTILYRPDIWKNGTHWYIISFSCSMKSFKMYWVIAWGYDSFTFLHFTLCFKRVFLFLQYGLFYLISLNYT